MFLYRKTAVLPKKHRCLPPVSYTHLYLVDLPGYGYAQRSKSETEKWGKMMEDYLANREPLVQTILLVDSRHKPTKDDITMANWIRHYHTNLIVVATKMDKLKKKMCIRDSA